MVANGRSWLLPTGLAVILTVLNAAKPAVVDDTAYLLTARHIAASPADPYGFEMFWYDKPEPAWRVLLPPIVPYWLALGIRLFGEHLAVLKLWLLPFALLLSHALAFLLRRFARGYDRPMLVMTVLGPAVLPLFDVMLDVPATAFGLSAVAGFVRACDRRRFGWVLFAGAATGLALQTKYTMLTVPPVVALYGLTHRRIWYAVAALVVAGGVFGGWETWVASKYGESHFLHHLREQGEGVTRDADDASLRAKLSAVWHEKSRLLQPMLGYLGWLGIGVWLTAAFAIGVPRWVVVASATAAAVGVTAVCVVPARWSVIVPQKLELPAAVFVTIGSVAGLSVLAATATLVFRGRWPNVIRRNRDSWFLAGWLVVELGGYFAMTPFPAARRVMGLTIVGGLLAARLASRAVRTDPAHRPPLWMPACGVAAGVWLFALDTWDTLPEKVLAERAAAVTQPGARTVWYNGHWGFQYYCDRAGMRPVNPDVSVLEPGDMLVFPTVPDDDGFYRPYHGGAKFALEPDCIEFVTDFVWDDPLPAQTIPNLYGGEVPVKARSHPRLRVVVYRVTREWVPERVP